MVSQAPYRVVPRFSHRKSSPGLPIRLRPAPAGRNWTCRKVRCYRANCLCRKALSPQGPMISSARRLARLGADACVSPPAPGRNVGRAFSPAALRLAAPQAFRDDASTAARRRRFGTQSTKCRLSARRSSPAEHRARLCPASQDTSIAKRQCTGCCPPPRNASLWVNAVILPRPFCVLLLL